MPHGPGEAAPYTPRRRTKPTKIVRTVKPSAAPKHPSTVIKRATAGVPKSVIRSNAAQAQQAYHPSTHVAKPTSYLLGQKKTLRHQIAANERKQAKIMAQINRQASALPKLGTFKGTTAPNVPHPKLAGLQSEHAQLTNRLGKIQLTVASRQERHPENIPIIGSPNTSTADALLVAAAGLPELGAGAAVGEKIVGAAAEKFGPKAGEVVGKVLGRGAGKAAEKPALKTAEQSAKAAEVSARSIARRTKAVGASAAKRVVRSPKTALEKAAARPFGAESRLAGRIGRTPAAAIGHVAYPLKADYLAHAAKSEGQALAQNPGQTLHTTARVAEQFPAAALAPLSALGSSIASGSPKPLERFGQQTADYAKLYAELAGPKGTKIAENKLGLIPAATFGLGARAGVKQITDRRAPREVKLPRAVARQLERARKAPSASERDAALEEANRLAASHESARSAHAGRKRSAVRKATERATTEARVHKLGVESIAKKLSKASRHKLTADVSEADLVHYLGPRGLMGDNKDFILRKLRQEKQRLGPTPEGVSGTATHDRLVIDAVLSHPDVLDSKNLREIRDAVAQTQARVATERATEAPHQAAADEAVRVSHIARQEGISLGHQTVHPELRGLRTPEGKPLVDETGRLVSLKNGEPMSLGPKGADVHLRRRATQFKGTAKRLEIRAKATKDSALAQKAKAYRALGEKIAAVESRHRRAERERILGLKHPSEADAHFEAAKQLQDAANAADQARHDEAMARVAEAMKRNPYSEPFYAKEIAAAEKPGPTMRGEYVRGRQVSKEKFRTGAVAQTGLGEHSGRSFVNSLIEQQQGIAERATGRRMLLEETQRVGGRRFFTSNEINALMEEGKLNVNGTKLAASDFAPTIQRTPALREELGHAKRLAAANGDSSQIYMWTRSKGAWREFKKQSETERAKWQTLAHQFARAQSMAIIGTSPVWFTLQLAASPIWLAYSHPNLIEWGKRMAQARDIHNKLPPETQATLQGLFGSTRGATAAEQLTWEAASGGDPVLSAKRAFSAAKRSPAGKILENLRTGGPLIRMNQRLEASFRSIAGLMETDRLVKDISRNRVRKFGSDVGELNQAVINQTKALAKVPMRERAQWLVDHPEFHKELQDRLERALGSWNHLSSSERGIQAATIFYPFMRASVRWFLWTAPLHTPLRYALIANLAQSNNAYIDTKTKGTGLSGYLTQYGTVPIYTPNGVDAVNLYRIAPGGNTLTEAIGSGKINLATFLGATQPLVGGTLLALGGQDPFGNPSKLSTGGQVIQNIENLNPISRGILVKHSSASKLFSAVAHKPTGLSTLVPNPAVNLDAQRNANVLSRLYKTATSYSHGQLSSDVAAAAGQPNEHALIRQANKRYQDSSDAWTKIDKWYKRYNIPKDGPTDKAIKEAFSYLASVQAPSSSSSSSLFSGSSSSSKSLFSGSSSSSNSLFK